MRLTTYQYDVDGETEVHNEALPSTTACQYLPGQPVNLLYVPIEKAPLRQRSASVGAADADFKTMNPADKYLTPRAPPPLPKVLPRLSTSSGLAPPTKRGSRSLSPAPTTWSARTFFGLRSQSPDIEERRPSSRHGRDRNAQISFPSLLSTSVHTPSSPTGRPGSSHGRDSSPLRPTTSAGNRPFIFTQIIPDAIEESVFEDENFASPFDFMAERAYANELSPPPSRGQQHDIPTLSQLPALQIDEKPLPTLPHQEVGPQPRSHFSLDTISTLSPMEGHFDAGSPWLADIDNMSDNSSFGFSLSESPVHTSAGETECNLFGGYSLPRSDVDSKMDSRLATAVSIIYDSGPRATFGFQHAAQMQTSMTNPSALDELFTDMGYLGDVIES